ncbi:peptidase M23 [Lentibacillus populi]|uniref:Peptidase M23 n=1 Tax=Lentibacillus populi TaxID=1827502 RepID=A0A9W5X517_9BACI|nr:MULTISPECIES: 3D domain-containing protein [Bacillaceae]GGB40040.1 peptidase M23 [Lentibacillus populi]
MTRKLATITLATIIVLGSLFFNNYSYAEANSKLENLQEQRKNVKEDLSNAEEQVAELMSEIEDLNKEMERVNQSLNEKQGMMEKTEQNITSALEEIRILQDEIKELETDIEKRKEILKERIASYQQAGGSMTYLEVIFGAQSFGDFISRTSMVNKITEADASLLETLENDIHKVAEKQKLALEKLDELNAMKAEQEETLAQIKEEKQQNEQRRESLEKKQQELIALIDNLQLEDKKIASLQTEAKQNIVAAARKSSQSEQVKKSGRKVSTASKEKVDKPKKATQDNTNKKTFTVTATAYTMESAGGSGVTHTGIDLRENPNTRVIAVDPNVIPLGSVVHVEGYGYAIAGDIGSAINGNKIDVYVRTKQAAIKWGVRTVKVTIQ